MIPFATDQSGTCPPQRFPAHLVAFRRLPDGTQVVLRPIRPEDHAIELAFIGSLSSATRYNRLLSGRRLTPEEIRRLTRIDYEREMAYIAVTENGGESRILGVARYVRDADGAGAEFAIVVADAWQHKDLGSLLLGALLQYARSAGVARLHGVTLATNQSVQSLARKFGFLQRSYPRDATLRLIEKVLAAGVSNDGGHLPTLQ